MKSYTQGRNLYGSLTKNTDTTNLTVGDQMANDFYRKICAVRDWPFLERTRTVLTTASTQFKNLPYGISQVKSVFVTVSNTRYTPRLSPSRTHWDDLNYSTFTSDIPQWYFIYNGQIGLWPTPATSSNVITINAKIRVIDLSVADYTTGTIVAITNGATTVEGSATSWTAGMAGRWIRITTSNSANVGDGEWYEISAITDTTHLELARPYGGTTITAGSATYTIGQMPLLPDEFQDLPWIYAIYRYWTKENDERALVFKADVTEGLKQLGDTWGVPTTDFVLDDGGESTMLNPNLFVML